MDDIRPLADRKGNPTGFLLVLRHFSNLFELRNWRDVCSSLSFEDTRLGVQEEDDASPSNCMKTTLNPNPGKGKGKGKGPGPGGKGVGRGRGKGRGRTLKRQIEGVDLEEKCHGGFEDDDEEDESFGGGYGGGSGGGSFGGLGGSLISAF